MIEKEFYNLKNKVAIVTGGYGHLGKYLSLGLANAGAKVFVAGKSLKKFNKTFNNEKTDKIFFIELDISSTNSIKKAFNKIYQENKNIDILVNNAFYSSGQDPEKLTDEEWQKGIEGTLSSVFRCIREVILYMKDTKRESKIINIASMYGVISPDFSIYENNPEFLNPPHYGTAKAGVIHLTKYYGTYLAKYNIKVNAISPGAFPSPEIQKNKNFISKLQEKIPLNRIGEGQELKGTICYLASEASSYVTGQNIVVDGGWTVC
jgi:gluconate 5-dehydrogenase